MWAALPPGKVLLPAVGTAGTSCCAALCTASAATRPSRGCALEREGSAQRCGRESILLPGRPGQLCGPLPPLAPELARGRPCPAAGRSLRDICVLWGAGAQPAGCRLHSPGPACSLPSYGSVAPRRASSWPHAQHPHGPTQSIPIAPHRASPHPKQSIPVAPRRASPRRASPQPKPPAAGSLCTRARPLPERLCCLSLPSPTMSPEYLRQWGMPNPPTRWWAKGWGAQLAQRTGPPCGEGDGGPMLRLQRGR